MNDTRAAQFTSYGPPQVLRAVEVPQPVLTPAGVPVRIRASSLDPHGAAGGAGAAAVQSARARGAQIAALAAANDADCVRDLGASEVLDYRKTTPDALPAFEVSFDTAGSSLESFPASLGSARKDGDGEFRFGERPARHRFVEPARVAPYPHL